MLLHAWPAQEQVPEIDLSELRAAIAGKDAARFLAAVTGRDVDDALQQAGPAYRWLWQVQDRRPRRWPCRSSIG
jgi:hypothetical protein